MVGNHDLSTIAGLALAALRRNALVLESVEREASQDPGYRAAVFATIIHLARELGAERGQTAEDILEELAQTTSRGEAGLFDQDPDD
jgi:hypothetical protein